MNMQTAALRMPQDIVQRGSDLQTTAEYIEALADVVEGQLNEIRKHMREGDWPASYFADVGDWDLTETILSLLRSQSDIVRSTSIELELALRAARV